MKSRRCIAFVSLEIYPATAGGVGILLHHTIRYLLKNGYEIVLLLDVQPEEFEKFDKRDRMEWENGHNLHVYSVAKLCSGKTLPDARVPHPEVVRSARIALALEEVCTLHRVEMVEFYDYCGPAHAFLATTLVERPAVAVRLHNTVELIARKIRSRMEPERVVQFAAERMSLRGADLVLSSGKRFFDWEIAPLYPEIDRSRVHMSPPLHTPVGRVKTNALAKDVVFYGRLSTFKGLDIFLKGAVLALRNAAFLDWIGKFVIIGPEETVASTYNLSEMKEFIPESLQERFEFTGRVTHQVLMERLQGAAFACFANRMESFCYAAHEVHTAGVPLILSDTATFRDHFVEGETALFFDGTPTGLAERMIELAGDSDMRRKLAKAGQDRAPSYLVDHYTRHLEAARSLPRSQGQAVRAGVVVLSEGQGAPLTQTLQTVSVANLPDTAVFVAICDDGGAFRFAGQRWRLQTASGHAVDGALTPAPEAVLFLRAGDRLAGDWFAEACALMGRRPQIAVLGGWLREGTHVRIPAATLLPEAVNHMEPGLRCLIRLNPRDMLQDALRPHPGFTEIGMLLEARTKGSLLLTMNRVACDVTGAVDLPRPAFRDLLEHDFDRFSRDAMGVTLLETTAREEASRDHDVSLLKRSRQEHGFFHLRAFVQEDGTGEVLLLRLFHALGSTPVQWSALSTQGDWSLRHDPRGPVGGAMHTVVGTASGYIPDDGALDVLMSPWSGKLEVHYGGQRRVLDLRTEKIGPLRITFGSHGVQAARLGQDNAPVKLPAVALSRGLPARFRETGRCESVLLCSSKEDFAAWPEAERLASSTMPVDPRLFVQDDAYPAESPLRALVDAMGTQRVVLSSRLEPTAELALALKKLPREIELGLAILPPGETMEGEASLLARMAAWHALVAPHADRFVCLGGSRGLLEVFRKLGTRTLEVSPLLPPPMRPPETEADSPVSIALLASAQPPRNIMHMVNAVLLAQGRGLSVGTLHVPESVRDTLLILDDLLLKLNVCFFDAPVALALTDPGVRRIAMACYPDEGYLPTLAEVATYGWLPMAGATSDLDDAPGDLTEILTSSYWEDSEALATKLLAAAASHTELFAGYARHAEAARIRSSVALLKLLGLASGRSLEEGALENVS